MMIPFLHSTPSRKRFTYEYSHGLSIVFILPSHFAKLKRPLNGSSCHGPYLLAFDSLGETPTPFLLSVRNPFADEAITAVRRRSSEGSAGGTFRGVDAVPFLSHKRELLLRVSPSLSFF
jgi:hypothetical protein